MLNLLEQAIALAEQGHRVLPLKPGSRVPNLKDWQNRATDNLDIITAWWLRRPQANVGLATGQTFIVIDVDTKKGKKGARSLSELQKEFNLPKTYTVRTASGGLHLYYQHPYPKITDRRAGMSHQLPHRPIKNVVDWNLPCLTAAKSGIDIRADGGQVVAPGMVVTDYPDKPYTVVFDIPRAELPEALIRLLPFKENSYADQSHTGATPHNQAEKQGAIGAEAQTDQSPREPRDTTVRAATSDASTLGGSLPDHILDTADNLHTGTGLVTDADPSEYSTIPDQIPAGGRDDTLFRFMCSWREREYPLAHAEILAKELHSKLEQPQGDNISLDTVITKLRRTYKTYVPSAEENAAVQEIKPANPITATPTPDIFDDPEFQHDPLDPQAPIESIRGALDRFVFCIEGNTVIDTTKHPAYATIKMDAFKSAYGNVMLQTSNRANAKSKPLPKLWIEHANRQTVDDYGYRPNGARVYDHLGTRFYNRWAPSELSDQLKELKNVGTGTHGSSGTDTTGRGDGVRVGSAHTTAATRPELKTFFDHLDFLFGNDLEEKKAFLNWIAYSVRYPERRVAHGVLIISDPGVGKSWFYKLLQRLVGVFDVNTASNSELESDFNGWVFGCSMVVIHELMTGNKKHMMQQLLSLITEERILINEKHKQPRMRDIYANFLCFSNHSNAAALGVRDRRFLVYHSAAVKASLEYYKNLFNWLDTDGPLHLLQYIHAMDLSKFNPGAAPMTTAAKLSMTYMNMDIVESAIRDAVEDRIGPFVADIVSAEVVEKYLEARMELSQKDAHRIRTTLTGLCPPLKQDRYRLEGDPRQHRLRAVRNGKHWAQAGKDTVINEYIKSCVAVSSPVARIIKEAS